MPGYNYWVIVGPVVIALAIVVWLWLVGRGVRRRRRYDVAREQPERGAVSGGRIEGGPSQVSRRDEAPRRG
ncbi:MAG TPA: hypothetical protein VH912_24575 [Streptosporangiaceae bacterium]|jgi:hypothetical protein